MKKNILTIVIMAATVINLVLSAILVFTVMPAMNKTSNLVDKVASVIDLEIEDAEDGMDDYVISDLKTYEIAYDSSVKINLQKEADGTNHYALLDGITVSFNSEADDYKDISGLIAEEDIYVQDIVKETIGEYTMSDITEARVKTEAVKKLQEKYDTKCIVSISLPGYLVA